jgi:hypothetical protein
MRLGIRVSLGFEQRNATMKSWVWVIVGLTIAGCSWIPLNMADRRDIPLDAAILGVAGSLVGGVIALIAFMTLLRQGPAKS